MTVGADRLAALVAAVALVAVATPATAAAAPPVPARATTTPIEHFVFLMQENHTFDNYFGTRPGVDGFPPGTCMPMRRGQAAPCIEPFHVDDRGSTDLDHSLEAFQKQYNGGKMDGFIEAVSTQGKDGRLAMAYYDDRDLPYYWNIADQYVLFDRFFSSSSSGSNRNHLYWVTGGPGNDEKSESIPEQGWGDVPTIFDRLEAAGISWKFYVQNYDPTITYRTRENLADADRGSQVIWVPLLAYGRYLDNPKLFSKIVDLEQYYEDAASGNLPAVSFVAPGGASEHPPGRVQAGQTMVRSMINQLMRSPLWDSSAFLWAYDDWGGWYDHVKPPQVDKHGYGFRVPALMVSAYARRGYVCSTTLDFTSGLKFIEENWGIAPLADRDRKANNFLDAFDFTAGPRAPVLVGTERGQAASNRPNPVAIYVPYTLVVLAVAGTVVAASRVRRRIPIRVWRRLWPRLGGGGR